jgi:hypothetical protein
MRQAENLAQVRGAAEEAAKKAEALQHLKTDAAEAAIEDNKEGGCRHQQQVWKAYTSKGYTSTSLHETISRALNECQQQEYQRASLEEAKQAIGAPNFRVEVLSNTFESHMVAPAHKEYMEPVCVEVYGHAPECHQGSYIVSPDYSTSLGASCCRPIDKPWGDNRRRKSAAQWSSRMFMTAWRRKSSQDR